MSPGRSEGRWEGEGEGAELPREEPEDIEGESGGVGCLSPAWPNGQAMGHLKGKGRVPGK
jgi:hypothetical protein